LGYSRRSRPKIVKLIQAHHAAKKIVWLRSRKDVDRFIDSAGT
jgi:hypothetical protein